MKRAAKTQGIAQHLPANKILWVLLAQSAVVVALAGHVPSWILMMALAAGVWRYHATRRQWRAPSLVLRMLLIAIGSVAVYASYGTLFGRDAGVAMIVLMLALKLLELNRRRDVVVFVLLGYFLIVTNFLYSQSVLMAAYMFAACVLLTSALVAIHDPSWRVHPLHHIRLAATLLLQAVPVALLLFLLFPRISGPLWALPEDAHAGTTGLSDRMSPGSFSQLIRSDEVAFRVLFDDQAPPPSLMYWRGPVLDEFDGRTWFAGTRASAHPSLRALRGRDVDYQITLEGTGYPWLLALDVPVSAPSGADLNGRYELRTGAPVLERVRYRLRSRVDLRQGIDVALSPEERRLALQLPGQANPQTRALAQELVVSERNPSAVVDAVLKRFHEQEYVYTLNPPRLSEGDSVDDFLFESRRGFCEHYAGAFAALMRAAGIPARVVTGYQGGEFNPNGGYWIVRQSDAHAWAEVWLPATGWLRVDPTAAIAPQRIERGIEGVRPRAANGLSFAGRGMPLLRNLGLMWDGMNNRWNQWVLGYSTTRQTELLKELGLGRPGWFDLALLATAAVTLVMLMLAAYLAFRQRTPAAPAEVRAYRHFCGKLARIGLLRRPAEAPMDFARRVAVVRPDLAAQVATISQRYTNVRYGSSGRHHELAQLKQAIREFSPRKTALSLPKNTPTADAAGAFASPSND